MKKITDAERQLRRDCERDYIRALKHGDLVNPKVCEECGRTMGVGGFHPDLRKPLRVIWLCVKCRAKRRVLQTKAEQRYGWKRTLMKQRRRPEPS